MSLVFLLGVFTGIVFMIGLRRAMREGGSGAADTAPAQPLPGAAHDGPRDGQAGEADVQAPSPAEYAVQLEPLLQNLGHPSDLIAQPAFAAAATALAGSDLPSRQLLAYASGDNAALCFLAVEAAGRRAGREDLTADLLRLVPGRWGWRGYYVLRAIHAHARAPVLGQVVARLDWSWGMEPDRGWLADFVDWRIAAGEAPQLGPGRETLDALSAEARDALDHLVEQLGELLPPELLAEYRAWKQDRTDLAFLGSLGTVLGAGDDAAAAGLIEHPALADTVSGAALLLSRETPRPVVVVGEAGVGKSAVIARLAASLRADGWTIFRCSAPELLSGQTFVGQMEDRIGRLVRELEHRRVLWIVPEFHELFYSGRTLQNPAGLLDQLFPHLERGTLRLVGETSPMAWEKILQQRPRLRGVVEPVRVEPLDGAATDALTRAWAAAHGFPDAVREEAHHMAAQHLAGSHAPGNVMTLLRITAERAAARGSAEAPVVRDDLLHAMAGLTGLPLDILDDGAALDMEDLRQFFTSRVVGQEEAVDTLLERIALIKAGLTDPGRPQGVFLFVGPSGTGKTELAKTLAEYLFGSPERMIRLDMSELQDPAMGYRLTGSRNELDAGSSLVDEVRRQPFSVVLLDEIEKAHPQIHDLFLQLFDDGRLTDQNGNTASFRNAIVIMTSNLGSDIRPGGIGFTPADGSPTTPSVQRSIEQSFRPEFINRIDRIICFRPLDRAVIRRLLDKEIRDVLGRRGLRDRAWALEWEEPAIEFLLRHGFTPALGARPLKRAVERYLLSPLAVGIAGRQFPEGDQFLYIRAAGDRLAVEFIDPDAAQDEPGAAPEPADEVPALEDIVRDARGDAAEVDALVAEYEHLREVLDGDAWQQKKQKALGDMAAPDFWRSSRRFAVLGIAEYMDRIEVGFETAGSLLRRVQRGTRANSGRFAPRLVQRLAQQLYLVGEAWEGIAAGLPRDAFVRVAAAHEPGADPARTDEFAGRIERMYCSWAERRGMRLQVLCRQEGEPYSALLAISGFAAFPILAPEAGFHVLELPARGRTFARLRASVQVVPQPDEPPGGAGNLLAQARRALDAGPAAAADVVRRYREEPSPLVRDSVRGWRTGRIDQVLGGDFDLVG